MYIQKIYIFKKIVFFLKNFVERECTMRSSRILKEFSGTSKLGFEVNSSRMNMHHAGIEPASQAWEARILPLN